MHQTQPNMQEYGIMQEQQPKAADSRDFAHE
jgi:hypothetical protein